MQQNKPKVVRSCVYFLIKKWKVMDDFRLPSSFIAPWRTVNIINSLRTTGYFSNTEKKLLIFSSKNANWLWGKVILFAWVKSMRNFHFIIFIISKPCRSIKSIFKINTWRQQWLDTATETFWDLAFTFQQLRIKP